MAVPHPSWSRSAAAAGQGDGPPVAAVWAAVVRSGLIAPASLAALLCTGKVSFGLFQRRVSRRRNAVLWRCL